MPATIKGGRRWARFLANAKRSARAKPPVIEAGFLTPHIATLAARLEFGDPRTDLPERPAFRNARDDAFAAGRDALATELTSQVRSGDFGIADGAAERAGEAMAEVIRASYVELDTPGLSERQERRKRGTPFGQAVLIGHKGPRLISHIRVRVS